MIQFNITGKVLLSLLTTAIVFAIISIISLIVDFIARISDVLCHSSSLTTTVCIISSLCLLIIFYAFFRVLQNLYKYMNKYKYKILVRHINSNLQDDSFYLLLSNEIISQYLEKSFCLK